MKIVIALSLSLVLTGCVFNRFAIIQELREAGCEIKSIHIMEESVKAECIQFNPSLYNVEMYRNGEGPEEDDFIEDITPSKAPKHYMPNPHLGQNLAA